MNLINKPSDSTKITFTRKVNKPLSIGSKRLFYSCIILAVCFILFVKPLYSSEGQNNLITAEWLQKNLNSEEILLLDASPVQLYSKQHIPGAINVNIYSYGAREIPANEMEQNFQSLGISPGKKIVLYDQGGTMLATRLFFTLYYYGYPADNLFILDGGLFKWQEKGFPVTSEVPSKPQKGTFTINRLNEDARVKLPEFITASGDMNNNVLLEALGADWHYGQIQPFGKAGHIPNAVMMPADEFFNSDKTFKSAEEIQKMLNYWSVKPEKQVLTHCGGGIAASVPFFVLKFILNYPDVKLFIESQLGWASDDRDLPFWTYDAPYLLRNSGWLQSWGGKMLRTYGISQVSIIDIRTSDEFIQGHIPYSINIPANEFKNNINSPDNLMKILSEAGVNSTHEAVIVSGSGLTKDAALAFVLLEWLGQNKVSVFMDSFEKWTQLGLTLAKDTSSGKTQKSPNELSASSTHYSSNSRNGIITNDVKNSEGIFPAILLTSGGKVPAGVEEKNVVHISYADHLNSDGSPKSAKEIWDVLSKSGVPRYAELVCFSEDPGEAAINYFITKLMGFPDVKVLIN